MSGKLLLTASDLPISFLELLPLKDDIIGSSSNFFSDWLCVCCGLISINVEYMSALVDIGSRADKSIDINLQRTIFVEFKS